jgi:hypothetical protein
MNEPRVDKEWRQSGQRVENDEGKTEPSSQLNGGLTLLGTTKFKDNSLKRRMKEILYAFLA